MCLNTWHDTIEVDLTVVLPTTREVLLQMIERRWGRFNMAGS